MKKSILAVLATLFIWTGCKKETENMSEGNDQKIVVYQVFTRLFGNTNTTNKAWGTVEENGVGKFEDFSDEALDQIRGLGVTHIWYTGVLHHMMITDYSEYGITPDDPDVVQGRAGSPYAIKDYYNVDPDLAVDPMKRMEEFEALVHRTHKHGMKVIIDIVPNHVGRAYHSISNPEGVESFGASDDKSVVYRRDNNFYYIPGEQFRVPVWQNRPLPLGGEAHPLSDGFFDENPAKWTGNGARSPQPSEFDWYETAKINFGVKPDGLKDFDELPAGYENEPYQVHEAFWRDRDVPDTWLKFRDIAMYWMDKGVDGFRYDMAQMVPVEFWSYLNSAIKVKNPEAILISEIYTPEMYRDYIHLGKMDYLYDKVQLYDSLKAIMQGHGSTDAIVHIQDDLADIEGHMLHFMENHDEQRIASAGFAGNAETGKPAMVVSATIGTSPIMLYFAQELGEAGDGNPGFGSETRTTIFDYWGVPSQVSWINNGAFDGGQLNLGQKVLRSYYATLLNFTRESKALMGQYLEIHSHNREFTEWYNDRVFSFVRWKDNDRLVIVSNFDARDRFGFELQLPAHVLRAWNLGDGTYQLRDLFSDRILELSVSGDIAKTRVDLDPLESYILILESD